MKKLLIYLVLVVFTTGCKQPKYITKAPSSGTELTNLISPKVLKSFEGVERTAYQKPEKIMAYIGDVQGETIMDLGAGSGYFTFRLVSAGARVIAAEVNDDYLKYIQLKADSLNVSHMVELRKVPYDSPKLEPKEIDRLLIVNTYHHLDNRSAYFKKVKAGLKPGGEVIVIDFFKKNQEVEPAKYPFLNTDTVVEELKIAGFTEFEVDEEMLQFQYIVKAR